MFGLELSTIAIICQGGFGLSLLFLWLTALAGTKFYQINAGRSDIKGIKFFIHVAFLVAILCFVFFCYHRNSNVEKVESGEKTEEIQEEKSSSEHRPEYRDDNS